MTKTSKQLNKIAFVASIFLASFEGEGRAQVWIEQQCAVNCVNTFNTSFVACMKQNPPLPCIQNAVTVLTGSGTNGINNSYPTTCAPNPSGPAMTATIDQQCAINCVNTFTSSFNSCSGNITCLAPLIGALSTCVSKNISPNQACPPPASLEERARR